MTVRTLHLPLKRKWFDLIKSGEKTEEYRLVNDYWRKRLVDRSYEWIALTLGYPSRDDTERRIVLPWRGYEIKRISHPEWGESEVDVFAIKLTDVSSMQQGR